MIWKFPFFRLSGLSFRFLSFAFLAKILAGFAYYLIYLYYVPYQGTSDSIRFFEDSAYIYKAFRSNTSDYLSMISGIGDDNPYFLKYYQNIPNWVREFNRGLFNDNRTIIRFNAVLRLVSFGSFPVHIVITNFLSFTGLLALYRFFVKVSKDEKFDSLVPNIIFASFLFYFPSVLFWGSGVSKEGLSFFGLGMFLYFTRKFMVKQFKPYINLALWLLSCYIMFFLKFYLLIFTLPLLTAFVWDSALLKPSSGWKYFIILTPYLLILLNLHYIFPTYNPASIISGKQKDFYAIAVYSEKDPLPIVPDLNSNNFSLVNAAVPAFLNTLAGPLIIKNLSTFTLVGLLEDVFLIFLVLLPFLVFKRPCENPNLFYFSFLIFILIFILIGLITPLPGAIMRYRIMALPFLFNAIRLVLDWKKLSLRF